MDKKQFELYKTLGKEGLLLDHYGLANSFPNFTADQWRVFLQDPEVSLYINQEFDLIRAATVRKLQAGASDNERSVGAAQLINAMSAQAEKAQGKKEGPVFIYSFVPPSPEQMKAPNIYIIDYKEAQEKGLQPKEQPVTIEAEIIQEVDPRWKETSSK